MGGGILPVALHKGKLYFLFSREYIKSKEDPGLWSDFGGSKEKGETYKETAIREGWEESSGILGSKKSIKKLVETKTLKSFTLRGYKTYIVLINYNKNLPKKFRKNFLDVKKKCPHLIEKNGFFEKDMLKWVDYTDLQKKLNIFRPWYKSIIKELIKSL